MDRPDYELRYSRQLVLPEIGPAGQEKIKNASVVIVGCGALGGMQSQLLARAGIGRLRLIDRDFVELSNLPRQLLFDEEDVAGRLAKVDAAARRLARINSELNLEPVLADLSASNIRELTSGFDLLLDATDNIETRFLINDYLAQEHRPWIYGGVLGTSGLVLPIYPGHGPCLRCLFPEDPPAGSLPTTAEAGIFNSVVAIVASLQTAMAVRSIIEGPASLLCGERTAALLSVDTWSPAMRSLQVRRLDDCPGCGAFSITSLDRY